MSRNITVVEVDELSSAHIQLWLDLRASNPTLDSPYFHPAFTAAVASTRRGVRVIVGETPDGCVASFLPVQFDKRIWRPAGWPAADFQGPISMPGIDFDITAALRGGRIASDEFDHMLDGSPGFEPWIVGREVIAISRCVGRAGRLHVPREQHRQAKDPRRGATHPEG